MDYWNSKRYELIREYYLRQGSKSDPISSESSNFNPRCQISVGSSVQSRRPPPSRGDFLQKTLSQLPGHENFSQQILPEEVGGLQTAHETSLQEQLGSGAKYFTIDQSFFKRSSLHRQIK